MLLLNNCQQARGLTIENEKSILRANNTLGNNRQSNNEEFKIPLITLTLSSTIIFKERVWKRL